MKRLFSFSVLLLGILIFFQHEVWGQNTLVPASGWNRMYNSGTLCDAGGCSGTYGNNYNGSTAIYSMPGATVTISGTYATESNYDYLYIYNGVGTLLASYSGSGTITTVSDNTGQGFIVGFSSDDGVNNAGFNLNVSYSGGNPLAYCFPSFSNNDNTGITSVVFNTISNATTTNTPSGQQYYSYTNLQTTVTQSLTYNLSTKLNTNGNYTVYAKAWIDWNQNGTFEAGEAYNLGKVKNVTNGATDVVASITVPNTATLGLTRMRVACNYNADIGDANACGSFSYGEVEDYTINVVPNCTTPTNNTTTTAICAGETKPLAGVVGTGNTFSSWAIQSGGGTLTGTSSTGGTYNSGAYTGNVTIRYNVSGGCYQDKTFTVKSASTPAGSINGPTAVTTGSTTTLSVNGGSLGTGASWRWYSGSCGGTLVGTGASITTPTINTPTTFYVRAEGDCNTTACVSITITAEEACDMIYVDATNGNDANIGLSSSPVKTLGRALALVSGSRNYIKMTTGTYSESTILELQSNLIIDGRYTNTSGVWSKSSNTGTSTAITLSGSEIISNDIAHTMGFRSNNADNWKLIDLNIGTVAVAGQTTSGNGKSNYAIHISNGSTGYEIIRCNISSGNASAGANGVAGGAGGNAPNRGTPNGATNGGAGGCGLGTSSGGTGGNGGSGGSAGTGGGGAPNGVVGGAGGFGGGGGNDNGSCASGRTTTADQSRGNSCGAKGANGSGSNGGSGGNGSTKSSTNNCSTGGNGADGSSATIAGANGTAGVQGTATYGTYFTPVKGTNGTGGAGGSGGGGGGGGGEDESGTEVAGDGGDGGGGGGGGGGAGSGASGGGGSFVIFEVGSTNSGSILSSLLSSGNLGAKGTGGAGGAGGNGGTGGTGDHCGCNDGNNGGAGGNGSNGGNGGKGGDGSDGISATFVRNNAVQPSPSVTIPNTPIVTLSNLPKKVCSNSILEITKSANDWATLPTNWEFVKYNNTSVTSQFTTSSNTAEITTTNTSGSYNLGAGTTTFHSYLNVQTDRDIPVITVTPTSICEGTTITLSANAWGTEEEFLWEIYDAINAPNKGAGTSVFSSTLQSPTTTLAAGAGGTSKTYIIRYQVKETCCGWSVPVFRTITVDPAVTASVSISANPTGAICLGTSVTFTATPTGGGTTPTYQWKLNGSNVGTNSATYTNSTLTNNDKVTVVMTSNASCGTNSPATSNEITMTVNPSSTAPTAISGTTTICTGSSTTLTATGMTLGTSAAVKWYTASCGGTLAGTGNTLTVSPTANTTYYALVEGTCNTTTCASTIVTVTNAPSAGILSGNQTICSNGSTTFSSTVTGGSWSSSNASIATINASTGVISPVAVGTATMTYTVTGTGGCGNATATREITINALPATPTIAAVSPTSNFCYGTNITYQTQSGKTNYSWSFPGTSGTDYTLVSGGTSTSNTAVIAWKNKTAGTIISVNYQENGCAASVAGSSSSITLPAKGTNLSVNNESVTCFVNGTNPVHFYIESTGNYVGSINPQGRQGLVTMTSYLSSVPTVQGDCSMPNNPSFHTAYMERKIHVDGSQLSGTGNVNVVLGYTNSELTALQTYAGNGSGGSTPNNLADDITSLINPNLGVTKVSGNGALCAGNVVNYVTVSGGDLTGFTNAKYIDFTVDNFSTFYIHGVNNNSALPITLTSFNASCDEKVNLTWKTATESNVSHFEILKSRDGLNWNLVETVAAVGNSTVENTYAITDVSSLETTYYKLRSVDNDGSSEDFNVVSVNCNVKESWSIHPIPVATKATVTIAALESMQNQFIISDVNGRVIYTQDIQINEGTTIYDLDLKHLSEGTYFIRLNTGDQFKPMKFIKVND